MPRLKKGARNRLREARKTMSTGYGTTPPRRSKPEREYNYAELRRVRPMMAESLEKTVRELENLVQTLNLEDLIFFTIIKEIGTNADDYVEARDTGHEAAVEFLVQLRLKAADTAGIRLNEDIEPFKNALDKAKKVLDLAMFLSFGPTLTETGEPLAKNERERAADEIIGRARGFQLVVRNDTYHHFGWDLLKGLFGPFEAKLRELVGFGVGDLIRFGDTSESLMNDGLKGWKEILREIPERLVVAAASNELDSDLGNWAEVVEALRGLPVEERLGAAMYNVSVNMLDFGCPLKYSAADVREESGLDEATVESILGFFSLTSGDFPADYTRPSPDAPLRTRPIVALGGGEYVMPTPYLFPWSIQERLEKAVEAVPKPNKGKSLKDRYEKHRGEYIEEQALGWLAQALPGAQVYRSLEYFVEENGKKVSYELDGLIVYDCHVILVEAKGGGLNAKARQGHASGLASRVNALLGEAHEQVARALRFVLDRDEPIFRSKVDGLEVKIDKEMAWSYVPITVSLQGFGGMAASYNDLVRAGFAKSPVAPWAVPFHDLRAICEVVESPAVLLAYVRERMRMSDEMVIRTNDELSWFGWFLSNGLRFHQPGMEDADLIQLESGTREIDNYFLAQMGQRTVPTTKPRLQAPEPFLQTFRELEGLPDVGASWVASRFLGCYNDQRRQSSEAIIDVRKRSLRDGRVHDMSTLYEEGGLTVMSCHSSEMEARQERLVRLAAAKKYQGRRPWWILIMTAYDRPEYVASAGVARYPYERDAKMDQLVRNLPSAILNIEPPRRRPTDVQGLD